MRMRKTVKPVVIQLTLGVHPNVHKLMIAQAQRLVATGKASPETSLCIAYGDMVRLAFDALLEFEQTSCDVQSVVAA